MEVNIRKLDPKAKTPINGSIQSAGYDLYAILPDKSLTIEPHTTVVINTGLAMEIPTGYFGAIFARSGLATKHGLRPANCTGVVDSDYRGEIKVALHNDTDKKQNIEDGERIAQLVIIPFLNVEFKEVDELNITKRGSGGFGHSGKK